VAFLWKNDLQLRGSYESSPPCTQEHHATDSPSVYTLVLSLSLLSCWSLVLLSCLTYNNICCHVRHTTRSHDNLYGLHVCCHVRHTTRSHDRFTFAVYVSPTRLHHRGFFGLFGGNIGLFWQKYRALLERDIRSLYLVHRHACFLHVYHVWGGYD